MGDTYCPRIEARILPVLSTFDVTNKIYIMKSYFEKLITPITEPKHINPRIKTLLPILALMFIASCNAQKNTVTLKVNTNGISDVGFVSVRGNIKPLSWSNNHELKDNDGDGIYESTIEFNTSKTNVKFKFIVDGITELEGSDSRVIWLKDKPITKEYTFNEYNFYTPAQINKIKYTDAQIEEDVAVLKKIVQNVHPTIYKFRDSVKMQEDFEVLEREMKNNPSISNVFGEVSKFAAKIKCSHTFTNPWNQGTNVDKAIFYQHDKIPFTFNRLGKRMFIDKNASDNNNLRKGLEIISINDVYTNEVLTRLSAYVTSDGSNYEKKLDRLSVTGEEKFSLFDIFYPIEFGSKDKFKLKLKDLKTNEEIEAVVNAVSKTSRTRTLIERYGNLATTLKEGWSFEIIDERTAKLSIKSFAVQRNEFDWKEYLDNVFEQLNKKSIANFIIDIRENEGGQGEVGEYILKRIIQKPIKIPAIQSSVRYNKIPEEFKKYINTWDKFPYDFSNKFSEEKDGRYILKQKY